MLVTKPWNQQRDDINSLSERLISLLTFGSRNGYLSCSCICRILSPKSQRSMISHQRFTLISNLKWPTQILRYVTQFAAPPSRHLNSNRTKIKNSVVNPLSTSLLEICWSSSSGSELLAACDWWTTFPRWNMRMKAAAMSDGMNKSRSNIWNDRNVSETHKLYQCFVKSYLGQYFGCFPELVSLGFSEAQSGDEFV